jgi:hypothetical protein
MLRTSGLLAIVLGLVALGSAATPAAAFSGASTQLKPLQIPAGQLPLPPRVPTLRPPYCAVHNCLMPPRPGGR